MQRPNAAVGIDFAAHDDARRLPFDGRGVCNQRSGKPINHAQFNPRAWATALGHTHRKGEHCVTAGE